MPATVEKTGLSSIMPPALQAVINTKQAQLLSSHCEQDHSPASAPATSPPARLPPAREPTAQQRAISARNAKLAALTIMAKMEQGK